MFDVRRREDLTRILEHNLGGPGGHMRAQYYFSQGHAAIVVSLRIAALIAE